MYGRAEYVAFFVQSKITPFAEKGIYRYDVYGYSSQNYKTNRRIYEATTYQYDKPPYNGVEKHLRLEDNYIVDPDFKRKGVGSAGLDVVKELAKELRCQKIFGERIAKQDTEEERKKLFNFYKKNGFMQSEENEGIEYDMSRLYEDNL